MREFAVSVSPKSKWMAVGWCDKKKAVFQLKHSEKGSIELSEKDIKTILVLLGLVEATLGESK